METLTFAGIAGMVLSVPLRVAALMLALLRRARIAVWILGACGGAIGLVPILIEIV